MPLSPSNLRHRLMKRLEKLKREKELLVTEVSGGCSERS